MLEEPILNHKELYQACIDNEEHQDVQNQVDVSYRPPLPEHHEETRS
jgi:hypothetical protein